MLLLSALLSCLLPTTSSAHEDGAGIDAGFANVFATVDAAGDVTLEMRISETDDCAKFSAVGVSAIRAQATVSGDLQPHDECLFGGALALPEQGRWTVTMAVAYDGHPTTIALPVGFSGEPGVFESAGWLHVEASVATGQGGNAWYRPSGTFSYAVIGLLIGLFIEFVRRRLVARSAA